MNRKILSLLLLALLALPTYVVAESTRRGAVAEKSRVESDATRRLRRGVRSPGQAAVATFSGRVLSASGQPLELARVDIGSFNTLTDEDGEFSLVMPAGGYTVRVTHVGYDAVTREVVLAAGTNTQEFRLNPAPTAQLRTTSGVTYTIDYNSTEFGYTVPFVGYEKGPFLDLCIDATEERIALAEIARVNGPAKAAGNTGCCEFDETEEVSLTMRDGRQINAVMVDTCQGSTMDVIAFDRVNQKSIYIPMANVQELVFP